MQFIDLAAQQVRIKDKIKALDDGKNVDDVVGKEG